MNQHSCKVRVKVVASVTVQEGKVRKKRQKLYNRRSDEEGLEVVASEYPVVLPLIIVILFLGVYGPPWFFPFEFFTLKSCVSVFSVCIYVILDLLHPHTYTSQPVVASYDPNKW